MTNADELAECRKEIELWRAMHAATAETMEKENARLRAALTEIRDAGPMTVDDNRWRIAKDALEAEGRPCEAGGQMTHSLPERLLLYARQFEDQHAPESITLALREAAGAISHLMTTHDDMADEIERLTAEVQTWVNHTKTAVWSDSEECKLLTADNERLRAALRHYVGECLNCNGEGVKPEYDPILGKSLWRDCVVCAEARTALEASEDAKDVVIYDARKAELEGK